MKKILTIFLCGLMFVSCIFTAFSSCSKNSGDNNTETKGETGTQDTTVPGGTRNERENISDDLPETDLKGYNFRIYTFKDFTKNFIIEEEIGEVINDAVYKANLAVEDRFNMKITEVNSGLSGDENTHMTATKASINAGDDSFDIAMGHDILLAQASLEGLFTNLYDVPKINFSKPWWLENTVKAMTCDGQMYVFTSAMSYLSMNWTRVLYINKEKAKDFGITVPYKDVLDGTWTLDKLITLNKNTYTDLNGDDIRDMDDFYGMIFSGMFYCTTEPFGIEAISKDPDEILKLNINTPRTVEMIDKMYDLVFTQDTYYEPDDMWYKNDRFMNNKALFIYSELGWVIDPFRSTDINYGILPMPKLNDSQEKYYAGYTDMPFVIPMTAPNLDRTGLIIEAMSAEGYKKIFPAYYEIALKNKYLQDEESIQILDIINQSRMLDFAYMYSGRYSMILSELFGAAKPSKDFASYYEKTEKNEQANINKLIEAFEKLAG